MDRKKLKFPLVLLAILLILRMVSTQAILIEKYYAQGIYPLVARVLSTMNLWLPFSLGEGVLLGIGVYLLIYISGFLLKYFGNRPMNFIRHKNWFDRIRTMVSLVLTASILFQVLWGLNYSRLPLKSVLNLDVQPRSSYELYSAMLWHVEKANQIQSQLSPDAYTKNYDVWTGYENLPDVFSVLAQVKGKPKTLISSEFFSYAGIAGIYNPFLGEANFNALQVEFMHPVVMAHELAHLQGIAREDEANFAAVAVCLSHTEPFVNYSGHMLSIIHMSNALYNTDQELWDRANDKISLGVREDLNRNNTFWNEYEGWFEEASSELNNTYLKANGLADGVKSYGRMVDLLLATRELFYTSFN